jgi:hypothetical protein
MFTRALIVASGIAALLAAGGCSTLSDYGSVRKEAVRNELGYTIGYKEMLRNERTGEVIAQVQFFTPMIDDSGKLVGYEEKAKSGSIIRDLEGRIIGGRFADLRSRGTNARSRGLMIVMRPADSQQVAAVSRPKIMELMASLSASDLRRVQ